jgi:hypothetical protein
MSFRNTKWAFVLGAFVIAPLGAAIAAEPPTESVGPSKEQRAQMASAHEKMASCLRSDRSIDECRREMRASCVSSFGEQGCPMMGNGGRMHRPMTQPPSERPDAQ